jgi:thiamine pyrophosphokinase
MKKAIILANGDAPSKTQINYLRGKDYDKIICADGGANSAKRLGIIPDVIIGDLDSISKDHLIFFSDKTKIIKYLRQNDTDVEKSLKYLIKNKYDNVIMLGATGNRLDHTICNLGIVLKFFEKISISIIHKKSFLSPYTGDIELQTIPGEVISVYGFDEKTKITSNGLKYPLKNISLPFGKKESTSNIAIRENVKLKIRNGVVFVIRDFNLIKKHDLI